MDKKIIKIKFCDFDNEFDIKNNIFMSILSKKYVVEFSDEPDFLFYSCFRDEYKKYVNCVKVFYTNENVIPNFNDCDYAIGFTPIGFKDRYLRCPEYSRFLDESIQDRSFVDESLAKRKFCNFIYHNSKRGKGAVIRQDFCKKLMEYKRVDCPGKVLNNMSQDECVIGDNIWQQTKSKFISNYKFTIAFENTFSAGYTTEKLYDPILSHSIPIYWGNPDVTLDFNPKAFVNCNDYKNFDEVIERIIELDSDDEKYLSMLRENPMQNSFNFDGQNQLEDFVLKIVEKGNQPYHKSLIQWNGTGNPSFSVENKGIYKVYNILGLRVKVNE